MRIMLSPTLPLQSRLMCRTIIFFHVFPPGCKNIFAAIENRCDKIDYLRWRQMFGNTLCFYFFVNGFQHFMDYFFYCFKKTPFIVAGTNREKTLVFKQSSK